MSEQRDGTALKLPERLRPPCPRGCVDVEGCGCDWNVEREAWPNGSALESQGRSRSTPRLHKRLVENAADWFVEGSDENLVRETLESLSCFDDPDRWLRRLALLRERLPSERKQALYEKKRDVHEGDTARVVRAAGFDGREGKVAWVDGDRLGVWLGGDMPVTFLRSEVVRV